MRWLKVLALGVAGVVLPVMLVFSAYLIASGSIGAAGSDVPPVPQNRVTEAESTPAATPTEDRLDDQGGRCSEPEHRNDPECVTETPLDSDNSGPGSGSDEPEESESDNSGPGSDNSGPGSDNSGSGSDNSGSGSGGGDD
jgi:hypothetical protein